MSADPDFFDWLKSEFLSDLGEEAKLYMEFARANCEAEQEEIYQRLLDLQARKVHTTDKEF